MSNKISSVEELIEVVKKDYQNWNTTTKPWFRGEPKAAKTELLPKLYRSETKNKNELNLLRRFRNRAPLFLDLTIPQSGHTDQWLFLAQHVGLPTRLLDWSEGLLIALYFALNHSKKGAVVWMLDPIKLNRLTDSNATIDDPLTLFSPELDSTVWLKKFFRPDDRFEIAKKQADGQKVTVDFIQDFFRDFQTAFVYKNAANMNIRAAWEGNNELASTYPIAVHPTYIHKRISLQLSRFTIWGQDKRNLSSMLDSSMNILKRYEIDERSIEKINSTLRLLGISKSSLFFDLDSLANDLQNFE